MSSEGPKSDTAKRDHDGDKSNAMRFVVGVDFGTTFTSVAFAHSASPRDVKLVQTWPGGSTGNSSADQVPTQLEYTKPDAIWGYQVSEITATPTSQPLKWFKLLLQKRDQYPQPASMKKGEGEPTGSDGATSTTHAETDQVSGLVERLGGLGLLQFLRRTPVPTLSLAVTPQQKTREIMAKLNVSTVTVVADFLAHIRKTTLESIKRTYWMEEQLESKVEWILTVPALWDDHAKYRMARAARMAGFGDRSIDFELISEPECGATYSLDVIQQHHLSPGDVFVLCDAGGGTVDLISYKITEMDPMRVVEVVAGSGALCGSVFLDHRFEDYMKRTLGDETIGAMKPKSRDAMMRSWEDGVKTKFGNERPLDTHEVMVPGVANNAKLRIDENFHSMRNEDIQNIFDPVVDCIIRLVSHQVEEVQKKGDSVKAILLVGGFGTSEYLVRRLGSHMYGTENIRVLQPVNARSAIARGALLRGLDGSIVMARRARRYYGSSLNAADPGTSEVRGHTYMCPFRNVSTVLDKMQWYIRKGAEIELSEVEVFSIVPIISGTERNEDFVIETPLYACELDEAPAYRWQNPSAIYHVCTLRSNFSNLPRNKLSRRKNSEGKEYYYFEALLRMKLSNEVWVFESIYEGKAYGVVQAKYM